MTGNSNLSTKTYTIAESTLGAADDALLNEQTQILDKNESSKVETATKGQKYLEWHMRRSERLRL